ncbi:MAG: ABC transporter ATP-binding protein [Chloroflexi bacterium]|nr:ABC transporter ATP-binding protein [Chloroflexota bacterium]
MPGRTFSHPAIQVTDLRKSYGSFEAVKGVDLCVETGEVYALLGPNGAGKTTTVEILEGHRERSAGTVTVLGHDPARGEREFRERIGIVLQTTSVDQYLSVSETVNLFRGYYPNPLPLDVVLEATGLTEQARVRVGKLSGGQQRRLDVAVGLAGNPELLFLDEPTTGFDPSARRGAWDMVKNLQNLGKTILLTTHYMEEAEYLADRVGIMVEGRVVVEGPPQEIAGSGGATLIRIRLPDGTAAPPESLGVHPAVGPGTYEIQAASPTVVLYQLTTWAVENDIEFEDIAVTRPSLEDIFIEVTSSNLQGGGGKA